MILTWLFLTLLTGALLAWLYINFSGVYADNLRHTVEPIDTAGDANDDLPLVLLICPGRNEAAHIPTMLPTLCEQDYPKYAVVFVDDESDDDSPRLLAEQAVKYPHLHIYRNDAPPPAGWVGKCWAVHEGYAYWCRQEVQDNGEASPLICFTDADIAWAPNCLRSAVRLMQRENADMVGFFPSLEFGSAIEAIVQLQMVLALGILYPLKKAMNPEHPDTLTGGAFMLCNRRLYDQIGGHEAVKGQVIEDINLGRAMKAAGAKIQIGMARQLLRCRMYDGWSDMWEGLTKNTYAGMEYKWWKLLGATAAVGLSTILAPVYLLAATGWLIVSGGAALALLALTMSASLLLLIARAGNAVRKVVELPSWYAWTMPLGALVFLSMTWASAWMYYRGGNVWKGRRYGNKGRQSALRH